MGDLHVLQQMLAGVKMGADVNIAFLSEMS